MKKSFFYFFAWGYRIVLRSRYRVNVTGLDVLHTDTPLLIMPNHQAFVDPQIVFSQIYRVNEAVPIVVDYIYNMPLVHRLLKAIDAVSVQDSYQVTNSKELSEGMKVMHTNILEHIHRGKNVILYPSGQIQGQGYEVIHGKQSAQYIISRLPKGTKVIGVRVRGLWGSVWSRAWVGEGTSTIVIFLRSIGYILANLIFFVPKRDVYLDFEDITEDAKSHANDSMRSLNRYLESFYNKYGEEKVRYIKHFFFVPTLKKELPQYIQGSVEDLSCTRGAGFVHIATETQSFVFEKTVSIQQFVPKDALSLNTSLAVDLQFDSLQTAELVSLVQEKFPKASHPRFETLRTLMDICAMAEGKSDARNPLPEHDFIPMPEGARVEIQPRVKNIRDACIAICQNSKGTFLFDKLRGAMSYQTLLLRATVASLIIKKVTKEERIGIMLPALQSTTLLIMATYLAGKTPVMFNWTVGKRALTHCVDVSGVSKILTAKAFFERIKDDIPLELHEYFIFLEDELSVLSLVTKVKGLMLSKMTFLLSRRPVPDIAVVLFTSGSESLPKPVPLTHANIIESLRGALSLFTLKEDDIILGILPPFHSFGFVATVILPLISGVRVAYSPDPTDSFAISQIIDHAKITVLPTAPTFLKIIIRDASTAQITSLQTVLTGAEACPKDLLLAFKDAVPRGEILEGYGITECSPVVAITPHGAAKSQSVGKVIPNLTCRILNIQTGKECISNEQGMIYVRGSSVFHGYGDDSLTSPFELIDGQEFYKTGDIGFRDSDDYLFITARLSRFVKVAGEMVSLPMVEELLLQKYGSEDEVVLAVEGSDIGGRAHIVCFVTKDLVLEEVNRYLKSVGVSNIVRVHELKRVEAIPTLGTGKIDYKVLKGMINA